MVGADGLIIAAYMDSRLEDETVGALAASIVANVSRALERLNQQNPDRITIEADEGKIFLNDAGVGILAVVTDPAVNVGMVRLEIKNAVSKIRAQ